MMPSFFWLAKMVSRSLFPAFVEQMHRADPIHPLLSRMMWRVCSTGHIVHEERLLWVEGLDRFIQLIASSAWRLSDSSRGCPGREDRRCVAKQVRLPLTGITSDETVKVLKAHTVRPLVERSCLTIAENPAYYGLYRTTRCA